MLDWDDLRFFLAVARYRNLASAAKTLNVTQSTVSRRVAALQDQMGVQLLHRSADGYVLTAAGEGILAHVERVEAETLSVEHALAGQDIRMEGTVRLACSAFLMNHLLAPTLSGLRTTYPGIAIEALSHAPGQPLDNREVDISVSLTEFDQNHVAIRKIGSMAFGLYGCIAYIGRHGQPDFADGCPGHAVIAQTEGREPSLQARWLTENMAKATRNLRTDSYETQYHFASCGMGLALLPCFRADEDAVLCRFDPPVAIPPATVWMAVHGASRSLPRIRLVLDCIAEAVKNRALLPPRLM